MSDTDRWLWTFGSVLVVSLASFAGVFTLSLPKAFLKKILVCLVAFAAGALFGDAFFHLLPEATQAHGGFTMPLSSSLLSGVVFFFCMEKFVRWWHCHTPTEDDHPHHLGAMNLVGDALHNFIDGLIIGGSYLLCKEVGLATTLAVMFHEIPQEIGDFGILLHAGYSRKKALLANFAIALTAFLGAAIALGVGAHSEEFRLALVPFAAGGFIYIAASDLIPELHKEFHFKQSVLQLLCFLAGIGVMVGIVFLESGDGDGHDHGHEHHAH